MAAGTDDCFAVVTNSLEAYFAALASQNPDWADAVHDAVGGAE